MFEVTTSKGYDAGKLNFVNKAINTYEFIGRTRENYGLQGFVEKLQTEPNNENTISVSQIGAVHAQIRKNKWYSSQNLLVVTSIDKILVNYGGYSSYPTLQTLKEHIITLPEKNGEIDFDFMEAYVRELEEERVRELSAYLKVSGLDNYELSEEEKQSIEDVDLLNWQEFNITEVFNIKNTKNILSKQITPGSGEVPYLCASADNNSVSSYISYNEEVKDKGNCIFIGGKTFVVSYQKTDFFSNDSHNLALYLVDEDKVEEANQLYLSTCIKKSLGNKYSWGDSVSNRKIQNDKIMIPVKDGVINYESMEKLISAVKKLVIKDVVMWADKNIGATKMIVGRDKYTE